jgi:hypothetical protein
MTEENLETIILGHIAKELKDEIQIGRTNSHRQPNESTKSNERDCGCCNSTDSDTCGSDNMVLQTKG